MSPEQMGVDGITAKEVGVLKGRGTLSYWTEARERDEAIDLVVPIRTFPRWEGLGSSFTRLEGRRISSLCYGYFQANGPEPHWSTLTMVLSCQAVHQVGFSCPIQPCNGHHHHRLTYLAKNLQSFGIYCQMIVLVLYQTDGVHRGGSRCHGKL